MASGKSDEEKRAKRNAIHRRWVAKHRDEVNAYQQEWRERNRERSRENYRSWYAKNSERLREKRRAAQALKRETQEREENMAKELELEQCPVCRAAGAVKVGGTGYTWGCSNRKCEAWIGRATEIAPTMAAAAAEWNRWCGENAPPEEAAEPEEARQDAALPDEAAAEPDEAPEAEAAAEEEAAEGVRFLVEVDGTFYWLEEGADGCEGCAFRSGFGKRTFCGATSVDGLGEAATLCQARNGVWREPEGE